MAKDMNIGALRTNCFRQSKVKGEYMLQMRVPAGLIEAKYLGFVQHLATTYGDGTFHFGSRQCFAIPGIKYENIDKVNKELKDYLEDIEVAQCGVDMDTSAGYPTIGARNIMACIGGIHCIKANINTQEIAKKIEKEVFPSHYHIKVAVAGCPNDCAKGHFNDFGIVGLTKPIYDPDLCIGCGSCVKACESHATRVLSMVNNRIEKDACCCVGCGECTLVCPTNAMRRSPKPFYRILIGGRTGKQYPRTGKTFADFLSEEAVLAIIKNWQAFSADVLKGQPRYLHGGHLLDMAGYEKFKEMMLKNVTLNPEARIAENVYFAETEYRGRIHVKPVK